MSTLKSLVDFEFRSDFETPDTAAANTPDALDTVSVTASELVELLANARAQGFEAANRQYALTQDDRLETLSAELKTALGELLELAKCLERVALAPEDAARVKTLIAEACSHIVAGQRDLFADQ